MRPIEFKEQNCTYAEDQPEYLPLPVHKAEDGMIISRWKFTLWERLRVLFLGTMWLHVMTFNRPLQPLFPSTESPFKKAAQ